MPTLLVPASTTMTLGFTPSSSPFSSRQRMFSSAVGAPAEVGGVPAEEVRAPVGEQLGVVGRAPAPNDRVADEVDVDPTRLRLRRATRRARPWKWRRSGAVDRLETGRLVDRPAARRHDRRNRPARKPRQQMRPAGRAHASSRPTSSSLVIRGVASYVVIRLVLRPSSLVLALRPRPVPVERQTQRHQHQTRQRLRRRRHQ